MDNYDLFKIRRGMWRETAIDENRMIYQCSECGNVDNPEKNICSCCRAMMEVENDKL